MFHLLLTLSCLHQAIPGTVPVGGVPAAPERLRLSSVDFKHVLRWDRAAGTSAEVPYSVSFFTDRGVSEVVAGCERVLEPLRCDLTAACSDPDETYHLRVTALCPSECPSELPSTLWNESGFLPIRDTELQPPVLRVALCNSALCVDVDAPSPHLSQIYSSFLYELKVESGAAQHTTQRPFRSLGRQVVSIVAADSQFCVSVRFADRTVPRESSFGPAQCVPVHSHSLTATVLPLLLGLLMLVLVVVFSVSRFVKKPALPSVLTSVLHSEQNLEVSCHPAVSSLLLIHAAPPEGHTEYCSSEETDSEEEQDSTETTGTTGGTTNTAQYTSKASLCSTQGSAACSVLVVQAEGSEEVDLHTLTFSRDEDAETSAALLHEAELPVCGKEEEEEKAGPEEESSEDDSPTGYMLR